MRKFIIMIATLWIVRSLIITQKLTQFYFLYGNYGFFVLTFLIFPFEERL